jgi:hypothetical protein
LESLDEFVVTHDFAFEGVLEYLVVFDLLDCVEVFLFVGFIFFGGVLVLLISTLEFLIHFNYVCF